VSIVLRHSSVLMEVPRIFKSHVTTIHSYSLRITVTKKLLGSLLYSFFTPSLDIDPKLANLGCPLMHIAIFITTSPRMLMAQNI
jgi:hypothetical protein